MLFSVIVFLVQLYTFVYGATNATDSCINSLTRLEWRELSTDHQQQYIKAVLCLMKKPSLTPKRPAISRYAEFGELHSRVASTFHQSALFLPWHRSFLNAFESALKTECNYPGSLPYWDWTIDSQAPESSVIWDATAFGGNGNPNTPQHCLVDGPFKNYRIIIPQKLCLSRNYSKNFTSRASSYSPENIQRIIASQKNYADFRFTLEGGPHAIVHSSIGGCMSLIPLSAQDPIFYLHHANVDRIWYLWQKRHGNAYGGLRSNNSPSKTTDILSMFKVTNQPDLSVSQVLNTTSSAYICYTYSNSVRPVPASASLRKSVSESVRNTSAHISKLPSMPILTPAIISAVKKIAAANDSFSYGTEHKITPKANDRIDKKKLRCPPRVPMSMITQMRLNSTELKLIRQKENENCAFVNFLNLEDVGYQSRASLRSIEGAVSYRSVTQEEYDATENMFDQLYNSYQAAIRA
ncbi:hypothetical protein BDV3_004429 [Batrachochytrium dendrobatidis]|uniref:Tyrosinase copper-binding domain-containing protein n=1 Tax=Batrachochytrium dendrobatidis (strain JEL423) TaxID=403673 RepID=A0A177WGV0_BATDL|nr:hypothetical protein BDEG_22890 [Batrachochytrium dendrobatidis JEL423]